VVSPTKKSQTTNTRHREGGGPYTSPPLLPFLLRLERGVKRKEGEKLRRGTTNHVLSYLSRKGEKRANGDHHLHFSTFNNPAKRKVGEKSSAGGRPARPHQKRGKRKKKKDPYSSQYLQSPATREGKGKVGQLPGI